MPHFNCNVNEYLQVNEDPSVGVSSTGAADALPDERNQQDGEGYQVETNNHDRRKA